MTELNADGVKAAHVAFLEAGGHPHTLMAFEDGLRAYLASSGGEAVPKVRPIPWQKNGNNTENLYSGELAFRTYYTIDEAGPLWRVYRNQFLSEAGADEVGAMPDLEQAKQLAQSDYNTRILEAIDG